MGYRDFIACRVFTDEGLTGIGEPYPVVPNDAVTAVIADFAIWLVGRDPRDITGKAADVPVYRLLGGKCRDLIRVCQGIGGATPEACAEDALCVIALHGYTAVKMSSLPPAFFASPP